VKLTFISKRVSFHPLRTHIPDFLKVFLERLRNIDACAVWHNPGESEILNRYCPAGATLRIAGS
jgi:hypothetical protein